MEVSCDLRSSGWKDFFVLDVVGQSVSASQVVIRLLRSQFALTLGCPHRWRLLWRIGGIVHPSGPRVVSDFFDPRVAVGFVCCAVACVALVRFLGERL